LLGIKGWHRPCWLSYQLFSMFSFIFHINPYSSSSACNNFYSWSFIVSFGWYFLYILVWILVLVSFGLPFHNELGTIYCHMIQCSIVCPRCTLILIVMSQFSKLITFITYNRSSSSSTKIPYASASAKFSSVPWIEASLSIILQNTPSSTTFSSWIMYISEVFSLIKSNAWKSFSSCPTDLKKLQNKFLGVLWYFYSNGHSVGWWPHFLQISQYPHF